jgi:putative ATPase
MKAMAAATEDVRSTGALPVPLHLRNAATPLMQKLGYGREYDYPHDHPDALASQQYLPDALAGRRYYEPTDRGHERAIAERLRHWRSETGAKPRR